MNVHRGHLTASEIGMRMKYRMTNPNTSERIILNLSFKMNLLDYQNKEVQKRDPLFDFDNSVIVPGISEDCFLDLCVKRKIMELPIMSNTFIWKLAHDIGIRAFLSQCYKIPEFKLIYHSGLGSHPEIPKCKNRALIERLLKNPRYIIYYSRYSSKNFYVFEDEILQHVIYHSA
ncbi:MAG: hypothetical protein HOK17_11885 [Flammeovirgaceae bacterium]|nr:hypothetical protein [Flammeovirgaceae bacterium]